MAQASKKKGASQPQPGETSSKKPRKSFGKCSPKSKQSIQRGNAVDTIVGKVDDLMLVIFSFNNDPKKAAYTHQHMKAWNKDPVTYSELFGVDGWVRYRNPDVSGNIARKVNPGVDFEWFIAFKYAQNLKKDTSFKDHAKTIPPAFQAFANDCELIRGTPKYSLQKHVTENINSI